MLALLYLWPFPWFEALRSPNELARIYQVRALVDDGTWAVNGSLRRFGPVNDLSEVCDGYVPCEPAREWLARCTGDWSRCFPNKAPGTMLLGAPAYAVLRLVAPGGPARLPNRTVGLLLRWLLCAVPTLLLLRALWPRLVAWTGGDRSASLAALLAYALGSLGFTYSLLYFSHQPAAVLLFGAFLLLEGRAGDEPRRELFAGLLAASAVVCEYTTTPAALVVGAFGLASAPGGGRLGALARLAAGAVLPGAVLASYHLDAYGSPFRTGYSFNVNRVFQSWHAQGFLGLAAPSARAAADNLFGARRGLFFYSPFLLLSLPGLVLLARRAKRAALASAAVLALYVLFASSFLPQAWGWSLGPRHLAPAVPFLVGPAAVALAALRARSAVAAGAAAGLCVLSMLVTGLASVVWPHFDDALACGLESRTLALLAAGRLPWNVLSLATGLGAWTWLPWVAGFTFCLGFVVAAGAPLEDVVRPSRRLSAWAAAAGVAVAGAAVLLAACPDPDRAARAGLIWTLDVWEPGPSSRPGLLGPETEAR